MRFWTASVLTILLTQSALAIECGEDGSGDTRSCHHFGANIFSKPFNGASTITGPSMVQLPYNDPSVLQIGSFREGYVVVESASSLILWIRHSAKEWEVSIPTLSLREKYSIEPVKVEIPRGHWLFSKVSKAAAAHSHLELLVNRLVFDVLNGWFHNEELVYCDRGLRIGVEVDLNGIGILHNTETIDVFSHQKIEPNLCKDIAIQMKN